MRRNLNTLRRNLAPQHSLPPIEGGGEAHGEGKAEEAINPAIPRKFRIDPDKKREKYLSGLEDMLTELENMKSNPSDIEPLELKAMDVMIRAVKMCYAIVRDADQELLEDECKKIEKTSEGPKGESETERVDFAPIADP